MCREGVHDVPKVYRWGSHNLHPSGHRLEVGVEVIERREEVCVCATRALAWILIPAGCARLCDAALRVLSDLYTSLATTLLQPILAEGVYVCVYVHLVLCTRLS